MAFNPYNQYFNPYLPQQTMPAQQMQAGGIINVRSEDEARTYPVAPGNSVTFKDDTQPYMYVKTQGFNQMEMPTFKKYRLVEEAAENVAPAYSVRAELEELHRAYAELKEKVEAIGREAAHE